MRTKQCLPLALLILSCHAYAQAPFPGPDEAARFTRTKTRVVLEDNIFSGFNIHVKDAMEKYWTITPYEFISTAEFDKCRSDTSYSFLLLLQTSFDRDKANVHYDFVNLLMGKDVRKIEEMPELSSFPFSYSEVDEDKYLYKLELIIRFMQDHAKLVVTDPKTKALQYLNYYNKNAPEVVKNTLLVAEDDLAPEVNTAEKIAAVYPYKVTITSHEEMEAAVTERRENTLIMHKVGPENTSRSGRSYKVIIGCDDARVYYSNFHLVTAKSPDGFLGSDFRRLARY